MITEKVKEYMNNEGVRKLQKETGVGASALYSLSRNEERKYNQKILDSLYDFFGLDKDEFYRKNVQTFRGKYDPLGNILHARRKKLGYSIAYVSKKIKGSDRHLRRIESGGVNYSVNSYYLQQLLKLYKFNKFEQNQIIAYSVSLSNILMLQSKEDLK